MKLSVLPPVIVLAFAVGVDAAIKDWVKLKITDNIIFIMSTKNLYFLIEKSWRRRIKN